VPVFDDKMSGPDDKAMLSRKCILRKVEKSVVFVLDST